LQPKLEEQSQEEDQDHQEQQQQQHLPKQPQQQPVSHFSFCELHLSFKVISF